MKKQFRIRKNEEFSRIIAKKRSYANESFIIYIDSRAEEHAKVGLSVSKKLGDAVTRNRIKRQIRMMFIEHFDFESYPNDVIVIARNRYLENDFEGNLANLEKLLKKAIM